MNTRTRSTLCGLAVLLFIVAAARPDLRGVADGTRPPRTRDPRSCVRVRVTLTDVAGDVRETEFGPGLSQRTELHAALDSSKSVASWNGNVLCFDRHRDDHLVEQDSLHTHKFDSARMCLTFDTTRRRIARLQYGREYSLSQALGGGGYRLELLTATIVLVDLPYTVQDDGRIICELHGSDIDEHIVTAESMDKGQEDISRFRHVMYQARRVGAHHPPEAVLRVVLE